MFTFCRRARYTAAKFHWVYPHAGRKMKEYGVGQIATIQGRYYAMDRGEDWDLTDKAYNLIVRAEGLHGTTAEEVVATDYKTLKTPDGGPMVDEYIPPTVLGDYKGMEPGSSVIFFNFRQDRAIN